MTNAPSPLDLKYFLEIAQRKNLTRAAERLGVSQPTLSFSLKRLEKNLKIPLVIRDRTGIRLTKEGDKLASLAEEFQQRWEQIYGNIHAEREEVAGIVKLGCHPSVGRYALPAPIARIMHQYPKLQIRLHHDLSRKILDQVISGTIDCALVMNPVFHPDLIFKKLLQDEVAFFQAPKNKNTDVLIYDPELKQCQTLLTQNARLKKGFKFVRTIESSNLEVIARLIHSGGGVGILPTRIASLLDAPHLERLKNTPAVQDELYFAYRASDRQILRIKAVLDAVSTPPLF